MSSLDKCGEGLRLTVQPQSARSQIDPCLICWHPPFYITVNMHLFNLLQGEEWRSVLDIRETIPFRAHHYCSAKQSRKIIIFCSAVQEVIQWCNFRRSSSCSRKKHVDHCINVTCIGVSRVAVDKLQYWIFFFSKRTLIESDWPPL
jgi:hypothetical protein